VRSFISNSNDRIPITSWWKVWLLTAIIVVLFITIWNHFWASRGVYLYPNYGEELWSYHRRRVTRVGDNGIVLAGSSKILVGIDQNTLAKLTGKTPIQLGIPGGSPIPVLRHLAEDESFRGVVISDLAEVVTYVRETNSPLLPILRENAPDAEEWIKAYSESNYADDLELRLRGYGREIIAYPNLGKNPPDVFDNIINGRGFQKREVGFLMSFDRTLLYGSEYSTPGYIETLSKFQTEAMQRQIAEDPPDPAKFIEIIHKIEPLVERIQARGGKVIFVNLPTTGEIWELYEKAYPKKDFWDVFAKRTSAITIHFRDYPSLANFVCIDGLHLDSKDAPAFTEALVKIIYEQNISK